ncbi:MAG: peptidase S8 [Chloroflexi bacterium]|nr:peptidase S8 [Chloroflexota bacterium]
MTAVVLVAVLLLPVTASGQSQIGPDEFDSGQILVKFRRGTDEVTKGKVHGKHGGRVVQVVPGVDVQVVQVGKGESKRKRDDYGKEPEVAFAELDYVAHAMLTSTDVSFGLQWGISRIQAPEAWDLITGSRDVKIAILDSGIDQDHDDIKGKIVDNKNFTTASSVDDLFGHGTHVAGIAAAATNNGKGVAGVAFDSALVNIKVLDDGGSGNHSSIAQGIVYAADQGAKVINMSFVGSATSSTLESAINYAWSKGAVLVAAAGNDNSSSPVYPASYDNVIAVAATDPNDVKAFFSNFGDWVDVAAPGVDIFSTFPNHENLMGLRNYGYLTGTSMAAPHVAGTIALLFAMHPDWTNVQVKSHVLASTNPVVGFTSNLGRVNAFEAVK